MSKYVDIKITDDDLAVNVSGGVEFVSDKESITQDIKHAIRESGYLVNLIGERSKDKRNLLQQKIIIIVEDDTRIIPGTVEMYEANNERWIIEAETYEYGKVKLTVF